VDRDGAPCVICALGTQANGKLLLGTDGFRYGTATAGGARQRGHRVPFLYESVIASNGVNPKRESPVQTKSWSVIVLLNQFNLKRSRSSRQPRPGTMSLA
jgi:hypothetical protein